MHPNLRTFLDLLTRENEIITIEAEVDPYLELAEVHRRVIDRGGPALLFKRVKGSRYPVVTNLFGTERRLDLAFGPKPEAVVRELVEVAGSLLPPRAGELWKHRALGLEALRLGTKDTSRSPVTQVRDQPARLDELPVLTTWQEDGGPFITLPLVYTENPVTESTTSGFIVFKFTTRKQPDSIGKFRRAVAFTLRKPSDWANRCRSLCFSAARRP